MYLWASEKCFGFLWMPSLALRTQKHRISVISPVGAGQASTAACKRQGGRGGVRGITLAGSAARRSLETDMPVLNPYATVRLEPTDYTDCVVSASKPGSWVSGYLTP